MEIVNVCECNAEVTLYDPTNNSVKPEIVELSRKMPTKLPQISNSGAVGMKIKKDGVVVWDGMIPYGAKYTFTSENQVISDADGWTVPNCMGAPSPLIENFSLEETEHNKSSINTYLVIGVIFAVIFGILLFFFLLKNKKMKK